MARMIEEVVVIKVSRLVRDNEDADLVLTDENLLALGQIVQELSGNGSLVEVVSA